MLKRLGARPGDCDEMNGFSLPSHTNLSPLQSAEVIADLFSQISQEYPPWTSHYPTSQDKLDTTDNPPEISEHEVYANIQKV